RQRAASVRTEIARAEPDAAQVPSAINLSLTNVEQVIEVALLNRRLPIDVDRIERRLAHDLLRQSRVAGHLIQRHQPAVNAQQDLVAPTCANAHENSVNPVPVQRVVAGGRAEGDGGMLGAGAQRTAVAVDENAMGSRVLV